MKKINVNLPNRTYPILIAQGLYRRLPDLLSKLALGNHAVVITCARILKACPIEPSRLLKTGNYSILLVPDGEAAKQARVLLAMARKTLSIQGLTRKPYIVCLGGGTVGDMGGFLAAIYKRGIPYVQVPTTLLAQIDSSIGGKTAIDLKQAKNILGAIYQPKAVLIDPLFLRTLRPDVVRDGMAEAIKYALISDADFFKCLTERRGRILSLKDPEISDMIYRCAAIKADLVSRDEKEEKGLRTTLNFGHTLGHALEAAGGYRRLTHGQAIGLGMIYAGALSVMLGLTQRAVAGRIYATIADYGLPVWLPYPPQKVMSALIHDKKFIAGKIRMVLLKNIGESIVCDDIEENTVKKSLEMFLGNKLLKYLGITHCRTSG